jgi:hyaluronan synthase
VRNEEAEIVKTVESCYAADYPDDRREVIVVNDGSTDKTWAVLLELQKKRFPKLRVFDIPPSGKRPGMAKGIQEARGELLVFVDSDTYVDPMALRHIVSGFEDPSLGAVSGLTTVGNPGTNLVTSMQEIKYSVSYDLLKTPESHFSCVTCCPGCLSAYRRKYVLEILEPWLNQTFLGAPATFGDDRSLTNFILRKYRVEYNPRAVCATIVPETWRRLIIQQTRWKKSWLRETLIAGSFMWKKPPVAALSFYLAALCSVASPFMGIRAVWLGVTQDSAVLQGYFSGLLLLGLTLGLFVLWRRPRRNWYQVWTMIASQVLLMGPLTYYAFASMRKNHWGTR